MSLKDIKGKIKSVQRTRKVTKAMEAVSAVKMRKSQTRAIHGRPYAKASVSVLKQLTSSLGAVNHPLTTERDMKRVAMIVVTSDKGLCGILNTNILKTCDKKIHHEFVPAGLEKKDVDIFAFGRKSSEHYKRPGFTVVQTFENVSDDVVVSDIQSIADQVSAAFIAGTYDRIYVAYTNFKSTFEQSPVIHQLLPLDVAVLNEVVQGIIPEKGCGAAVSEEKESPKFYTIEPSPEEVLKTLIPKLVGVVVYHGLLESKASEHSARMVAMKNASDKSKDLSKALNQQFNKARQSVITREISEIVGGIEAMATS